MKTCLVGMVMAALAAAGCSSSTSTPAPSTVYCSATIAGSPICYGYSNLNADQQKSVTDTCKQSLQGSIVDSCPTSGLVGCCTYSQAGISTKSCYYKTGDAGLDETTAKSSCSSQSGTWSQN